MSDTSSASQSQSVMSVTERIAAFQPQQPTSSRQVAQDNLVTTLAGQLTEKLVTLETLVRTLRDKEKKHEDEIEALQAELAQSTVAATGNLADLQEAQELAQGLQQELSKRGENIGRMETEIARLGSEITQITSERDELKSQLDNLQSSGQKNRDSISQLQSQLEASARDLAAANAEKEQLRQYYDAAVAETKGMEVALDDLAIALEASKTVNVTALQEMQSRHRSEIKDLQTKIAQAKSEYDKMKGIVEEAFGKLNRLVDQIISIARD